jgi:hypothetical protein
LSTRSIYVWLARPAPASPVFDEHPRDVVTPHVPSELERFAIAGVWVRATRKQKLHDRKMPCIDSEDERKASARVHVRPSIHKQANNRERAVVRGDSERLRVATVRISSSSQKGLHLYRNSALGRRQQVGWRRVHVRLSSGDRGRERRNP